MKIFKKSVVSALIITACMSAGSLTCSAEVPNNVKQSAVSEETTEISDEEYEPVVYPLTDTLTWSLQDIETLVISGTGDIPDYTDHTPPWFKYKGIIKKIIVGEGVSKIGKESFSGFHKLEMVELPESVEIIEDSAFSECESLTDINFGDNLREIKAYAFSKCSSLSKVEFGNNLETIWNSAFENSGLSGNITIPASVKIIGSSAFFNCKNVESYTILNPDLQPGGRMGFVHNKDYESEYNKYNNIIYAAIPTTFYGYSGSKTEEYTKHFNLFEFSALDNICEKGDVNLDGKFNIADLILLQNYLVGKTHFTDKQWACADTNNDKDVNSFDAVNVKRKLMDDKEDIEFDAEYGGNVYEGSRYSTMKASVHPVVTYERFRQVIRDNECCELKDCSCGYHNAENFIPASFDDKFFDNKAAIIIYPDSDSGNVKKTVDKITKIGNKLLIHITTVRSENPTPDMTYKRIIVSISKSTYNKITAVECIYD